MGSFIDSPQQLLDELLKLKDEDPAFNFRKLSISINNSNPAVSHFDITEVELKHNTNELIINISD